MKRLINRQSYANVMATVAVFMSLAGTSYAAVVITGANIKNSTVTGSDLRNGSVQKVDLSTDVQDELNHGDDCNHNSSDNPSNDDHGSGGNTCNGSKGDKGDRGEKGDKGDRGEAGLAGLDGQPGAPGLRGETGPQGDTGLQGPAGTQGDQGVPGATGPQGAPGASSIGGVIPPGTTVRGVWGDIQYTGNTRLYVTSGVSFPAEAPIPLTDSDVNFAASDPLAKDGDPSCTGSYTEPTAPAGKVCIYVDEYSRPGGTTESRGYASPRGNRFGFYINHKGTPGVDLTGGWGSWAYTAPEGTR